MKGGVVNPSPTPSSLSLIKDLHVVSHRQGCTNRFAGFFTRPHQSHSSGFKSAFHPFETPDRFEEMAEEHLRRLMRDPPTDWRLTVEREGERLTVTVR